MLEVSKFVESSLALIALERETEVSKGVDLSRPHYQLLELRGLCLQKLKVASESVGLYGRHVAAFELATHGRKVKKLKLLPSCVIGSGDIVGVFAGAKALAERPLSGVVTRCSETTVSVAFDSFPQSVSLSSHDGSLVLIKLANDVTYSRIRRSLEELKRYGSGPACHLVEVLFGVTLPSQINPHFIQGLDCDMEQATSAFHVLPFVNPTLDASQRRAVVFALSRPDIAIIHGPPGTGKTTTVVEVILQSVKMRKKVLACAPSNIAVDNLVERLALRKAKVVRIGHPARLVDSVVGLSLDAQLSASESAKIIQDVRKEIQKASVQSGKAHTSSERRKWRSEVKALKKELHEREEKVLKELLSGVDVVLATITGASLDGPIRYLPDGHFDLVVIDECAQAIEASCWIPLLRATKCVLAGDHLQLPPVIRSQEAAKEGLSVTLMERLVKLYGSELTTTLTMQYRMHHTIMAWPSQSMYEGELEAHGSVEEHLLKDMVDVKETRETSVPLLFIDTAGCDLRELETPDEESKGNEGEADLVIHHLKALLAAGVSASDIAVIAPYNLQVELIRQRLSSLSLDHSKLEVHSVDGFQGREKEAVVISFTRSNTKGEYGFLGEQRRTNVAITRARRHLALIGDSETVCNEPFIKGLIDHCHRCGEVWSADEFLQDTTFEEAHYYKPRSVAVKEQPSQKHALASSQQQVKAKKPVHTTKERKERQENDESLLNAKAVETKFKDQLMEFIEQEESVEMPFPSTLNANERRIIHELCDELNLLHVSRGDGSKRFIEVKKKQVMEAPGKQVTTQISVISQIDDKYEASVEDEHIDEPLTAGTSCCINERSGSSEHHPIQCERRHPATVGELKWREMENQQSGSTVHGKPHSKAGQIKKKKASAMEANVPDDLDAMLAEMSLLDSTCGFPKCKKSINLLGLRCQFCNHRFCMEHSIPEVHGCSDAAKKHAQQRRLKGTSKNKSVDPVRRAQLQKKLDKKIVDLSSGRKTTRGGQ